MSPPSTDGLTFAYGPTPAPHPALDIASVDGRVEIRWADGKTTYVVSGAGLGELAAKLERMRGIGMVAPFGTSLHVSGRDEAALDSAIAPYRNDPRFNWEKSQPSLEDVFIDLMSRARDNFQDAA